MIQLDNVCGKVLVLGRIAHLDVIRIAPELEPVYYNIEELLSGVGGVEDMSLPYANAFFSIVIIGDIAGVKDKHTSMKYLFSEVCRVCQGEIILTKAGRAICPVVEVAEYTPIDNPEARVLVLSNMYPFSGDYVSGVFVYDQVLALREKCNIDARVVSGKSLFVGGLSPLNIWHAQKVYGNQIMKNKAMLAEGKWQSYGNVPVCYFPWRAGAPLVPHVLYSKSYVRSLLQMVEEIHKEFPFEIVHAHTSFLDGNAARAIAEKYNVPYVITEHTGPFSVLTKKPWIRTQTFAAIRGAKEIWGVSDFQQQTIQKHFAKEPQIQKKIEVLYNGVDTSIFYPCPEKKEKDITSIMYIGYLVDIKNVDVLITAFGEIAQEFPMVVLKIVGTGNLAKALRKQANTSGFSNRIQFYGQKDHSAIPQMIRDECDVLVLCSQGETFGVVLAEALASGKPCVATKCGGPESIITESFLGELCEPGDVTSLANALRRVLQNNQKYDSQKIAEHTKQTFDSETIARQLARKYRKILCCKAE